MSIFYKLPMITESVTVSDCMLTVRFCIHTAKAIKTCVYRWTSGNKETNLFTRRI